MVSGEYRGCASLHEVVGLHRTYTRAGPNQVQRPLASVVGNGAIRLKRPRTMGREDDEDVANVTREFVYNLIDFR